MKTKLFIFLFALVVSTETMFAISGICGDNVIWVLSDEVLTISGSGDMADFSQGDSPWSSYSASIQTGSSLMESQVLENMHSPIVQV